MRAKGERENEYGISEYPLEFDYTYYYYPINTTSGFFDQLGAK